MKRALLITLCGCQQLFGLDSPTLLENDAATARDSSTPHDAAFDAPMADARVCSAVIGCAAFTCAGSSSCYYACGTATGGKLSYPNATTACMAEGLGCLATINSQAENDCIAAATTPSFPNALVWFGFQQSANAAEPLNGWGWQCGSSSFIAANWGSGGEPNDDGGSEDCALMTTGGAWIDANCTGTARYLCELP